MAAKRPRATVCCSKNRFPTRIARDPRFQPGLSQYDFWGSAESVRKMAYDEQLAERVRPLMRRRKGFSEKKMFGGVGFLLSGNMCVGVWKEFLILRLGLENYETALSDPDTREFDITGRAMRGWVMVEPAGVEVEADLIDWISQAVKFVRTLPAK